MDKRLSQALWVALRSGNCRFPECATEEIPSWRLAGVPGRISERFHSALPRVRGFWPPTDWPIRHEMFQKTFRCPVISMGLRAMGRPPSLSAGFNLQTCSSRNVGHDFYLVVHRTENWTVKKNKNNIKN